MLRTEEDVQAACEAAGIVLASYRDSASNQRALCPACRGGSSNEASLGVTIKTDPRTGSKTVLFNCFRAKCAHKGALGASAGAAGSQTFRRPDLDATTQPLSSAGRAFLQSRGISVPVMKANGIRSATIAFPEKNAWVNHECIVFPYVKNQEYVNAKYRSLEGKRFRQEKNAEKIVFGYDDVMLQQELEHTHPAVQRRQHLDALNSKRADKAGGYVAEARPAESALENAGIYVDGDWLDDVNVLIITEGEIDKMSCNEAGLWNAVSVPDGAPAKAAPEDQAPPPASQDRKFSYMDTCVSLLSEQSRKADVVVLAVDADEPGQALALELARRLGRNRCFLVRWPESWWDHVGRAGFTDVSVTQNQIARFEAGETDDDGSRKDANEVLMKDGIHALRFFLRKAKAWPIEGLYAFSDFERDIWAAYDGTLEGSEPVSTGWPCLDEFYTVVPGELTVVTGVPNSGKSEFVDALTMSLALNHNWATAFCSMEKLPPLHFQNLAEKLFGKPFSKGRKYAKDPDAGYMSEAEVHAAIHLFESFFPIIRGDENMLPSIDWVLEKAKDAVLRVGIRGLVIDPYNELEHQRPAHVNETEYISQMLSKIKRFAQLHSVHVWLVAHPKQLQQWKGEAPGLYDISGSAHFNNKADVGLVVHRNFNAALERVEKDHANPYANDPLAAQIILRKVRNKQAGKVGQTVLLYERYSGRYYDVTDDQWICPITTPTIHGQADADSLPSAGGARPQE